MSDGQHNSLHSRRGGERRLGRRAGGGRRGGGRNGGFDRRYECIYFLFVQHVVPVEYNLSNDLHPPFGGKSSARCGSVSFASAPPQVAKITAVFPSHPVSACTAPFVGGAARNTQTGVPMTIRSDAETSMDDGFTASGSPPVIARTHPPFVYAVNLV
ncbi:hypothetical protein [Methanogenium cariaci]|uniref:hypothetical protein n=1 Tax=Methanogenium cariaci TaxID=2197 RepID=UPI000784B354|nr:hypothetical protein [Methanogenium cariaci]